MSKEMTDENTEQGGNTDHSYSQGAGNDGLSGGGAVGGTSPNGGLLEKEVEGKGNKDGESVSVEGTQSNTALNWGFSTVWNNALDEGETRTYEPRERIFATELGKAPVDVYLMMKGEQPTNPPNARSKRKFEAGNMWEWIVGIVLKRAGIIQSAQERVEHQLEGMCVVSGRLDYIAGGTPDVEKAKAEIAAFELPAMFYKGFDRIVEHLHTNYPNGLGNKPFEIKSLSSYMYEAIERSQKALASHRLQLLHYMIAKGFTVGHIVYICRDDCRMMEIPVVLNQITKDEYSAAVALRSGYFQKDEMPPLEEGILWDKDLSRFTKNNMGIGYSAYLTKLYGFKDQAEFDAKYQPIQMNFNRVLKRVATGAKMTDKNLVVLEEMRSMGFIPEELAKSVPLDAPDEEEVTE